MYKTEEKFLISGGYLFSPVVLLFFLQLFFLGATLLNQQLLADLCFLLIIFSTIFFFFLNKRIGRHLLVLLGVFFLPPTITLPIADGVPHVTSLFPSFFLPTDRFDLKSIIVFIYSLMFFLYLQRSVPEGFRFFQFLFIFLYFLVVSQHDYIGYSKYQVILDSIYFFSAYVVFLAFLAMSNIGEKFKEIRCMFPSFMWILSAIVIFDLILTYFRIFSWSISWRGASQGVFFGSEVVYSFYLGVVFLFLIGTIKKDLIKLLLLPFALFFLFSTENGTAVFSMLLSYILVYILPFSKKQAVYVYFLLILSFSFLLYFYSSDLLEVESSYWSRLGTYVVALSMLQDSWLFGIMPGSLSIVGHNNLSFAIYDAGYISYLANLHENISSGLIARAQAVEGGQFVPHSSFLLLISSYGLIVFLPALFYYLAVPYRVVCRGLDSLGSHEKILASLVIFNALFSWGHPYLSLVFVVFISTLLLKNKLE